MTINTIIRTAWSILLSKYNRTEDVVFGAVVSGRPPEIVDIEKMIGLFINTIPVRTVIHSEGTTINSILMQVQARALTSDP